MLSTRAEDFGMIVHVNDKKVQIWHALEKPVGRPLKVTVSCLQLTAPGNQLEKKRNSLYQLTALRCLQTADFWQLASGGWQKQKYILATCRVSNSENSEGQLSEGQHLPLNISSRDYYCFLSFTKFKKVSFMATFRKSKCDVNDPKWQFLILFLMKVQYTQASLRDFWWSLPLLKAASKQKITLRWNWLALALPSLPVRNLQPSTCCSSAAWASELWGDRICFFHLLLWDACVNLSQTFICLVAIYYLCCS